MKEVLFCDMRIDLRGLGIGVAEEFLDIADVRAVFEEVGGKAVAKGMDAYVFHYSNFIFSSGKDFLYRARAEMTPFLAFEEPCLGFIEVDVGFQEAFSPSARIV